MKFATARAEVSALASGSEQARVQSPQGPDFGGGPANMGAALSAPASVDLGPQYWGAGGLDRGGTAANGKLSFTLDEVGFQLTRSETRWSAADGQPATVTYAYRSTAPATLPTDVGDFLRFTDVQINAMELALKSWSDVANITFTRVGTGTTGDAAYSDNATMLMSGWSVGKPFSTGFAYFPGSTDASNIAGDVFINYSSPGADNPTIFSYAFSTLTHELGHALGLSHPGDYNAAAGRSANYNDDAGYYEDSLQYSIMSYFSASNTGANLRGQSSAAPLLDDIVAAQRLYGANLSTRTGDTTYGFNSNADRDWYKATPGVTAPLFAVWDAGGTDTFDWSGYSQSQTIDLRQGAFSSVGGSIFNVAIAKGAVIENAVGGSGSDTIRGNDAANVLSGGDGADFIDGGAGNDRLDGGAGYDAVTFGLATRGVFVSLQSQGAAQDTLVGSKTLSGFEAVTGSAFDDALVGDAGSNEINGGAGFDRILGDAGDDFLTGGAGVDWLTGGAGGDRFIVVNAADSALNAADVIWDYQAGLDLIDLNGLAYATNATISIAINGTSSYIYADLNGDGTAESLVIAYDRFVGANDVLFAGLAKVYVYGGASADTLTGTAADDVISGGDGADRIIAGAGADSMYGGTGADVFVEAAAADAVGTDVVFDFVSGTDKIDLSGVVAEGAKLTVASNGSSSFLYMTVGETTSALITYLGVINGGDLVTGPNAAALTYYGSGSADSFIGGAAADVIAGFGGTDTLSGGGGADQLYGGAGAADTFKYNAASDSTVAAYDYIQDFEKGVDKVDLRSAHVAGANDIFFLSEFGGSTFLYVDIGNDGVQDMLVLLSGVTGVSNGDILF